MNIRGSAFRFSVSTENSENRPPIWCAVSMLWLSISPDRLDTVGRALADHAEVSFAAASTGAANLIASISCPDDAALYAYLAGKVAALQGVIDVETVPIVAAVKRHVSVDDAWVAVLSRR